MADANLLIGDHPRIVETRELIKHVAESPAKTILIYGETGAGKGLVARMLHELSSRATHPFVDVNCAAIPDNLLESELFGYEKGAFTGAITRKMGLVEAAHRGTIFLDEIREMGPPLQAKLLSLLDTQRFRAIGAVQPIGVNVRFIAATNKILLSEVKAGKFREDLYYRLQVIAINLPPLRERGDDIMVLTEYFLEKYAHQFGRRISGVTQEAREIFLRYSWPGNVRELANLIERAVILGKRDQITVDELPARIIREVTGVHRIDGIESPPPSDPQATHHKAGSGTHSFHAATADFQRSLIRSSLLVTGGHLGRAAMRLGLTRHALRHQMSKLGMETAAKESMAPGPGA